MPDRTRKPAARADHPPKSCATCGRTIEWRKKWERDWDSIRFCSDGCRHHKPSDQDRALEAAILDLLAARGRDKTICPSEAARAVASQASAAPRSAVNRPGAESALTGQPPQSDSPADPATWQPLMEPARAAARRLVAAGRILITQGGHTVDPSTAKGPIRLRLR